MKAFLLAVMITMLSCGASFAGEPSDKPSADNPAPTDESAKVEQPERKNVPSNPQ